MIALVAVMISVVSCLAAILKVLNDKSKEAVITQNHTMQATTTKESGSVPVGVNMGTINTGTMTVNLPAQVQSPVPARRDTWRGDYTEPLIDGDRTVTLILNCTFKVPAFTGLSYEPGYIGQTSGISGTMSGISVHFTKISTAGGKVSFDGTLDRSSKTIEGKWTSDGGRRGTFRLRWSPVPSEIE